MASVVIVHAAEDGLPARALAEKLRAANLTPVIEIPPGESLRAAMRDAAAIVALWSPRSVTQEIVITEAGFAQNLGPVIHARMQNAPLPPAFANTASIDLTGWRGEDEFAAWRELANAVTTRAGVPPLPPPTPRPASSFFEPGAPPTSTTPAPSPGPSRVRPANARPPAAPPAMAAAPPPSPRPETAPRAVRPNPLEPPEERGGGKLIMIGVITFVVVAALGVGGYMFWTNNQGSQAAKAAWEEVDRADPAALRAFIASQPGALRAEAENTLATLEDQSFDDAREIDSIEAFEGFLADFPDSDHALAARGRIAELRAMPAPITAPTEEIDPLTGLPYPPANPDLLPPGAVLEPDTGGPAPITPPSDTPPPAGAPL